MKTVTCYTIRYQISGKWHHSLWKMPLDYADRQYIVELWEPVLESAEEMQINLAEIERNRKNSTSGFQRNTTQRPYANPKRPPILNWPHWPPIEYPSDEDWAALTSVWERCKGYRSG